MANCTNPWHAGASLGSQFFPACPSCGDTHQPLIETKADDEHGFERPWIALIDGKPLNGKRGLRTFKTSVAARNAALKSSAISLQSSAKGAA